VIAPHDNALDDDSPAPQQTQASSKGEKKKKEVNNNFGSTDGGKPVSEWLGDPVRPDDEAASLPLRPRLRPCGLRQAVLLASLPERLLLLYLLQETAPPNHS
jgi:hypothetical protein